MKMMDLSHDGLFYIPDKIKDVRPQYVLERSQASCWTCTFGRDGECIRPTEGEPWAILCPKGCEGEPPNKPVGASGPLDPPLQESWQTDTSTDKEGGFYGT